MLCSSCSGEEGWESSKLKQQKGNLSDTSSDLQGIHLSFFPTLIFIFRFISIPQQWLIMGTNTSSSATFQVGWSTSHRSSRSATTPVRWSACHALHVLLKAPSCALWGRPCKAAPSAPHHVHHGVLRHTLWKATLPPVGPGLLIHAPWCSLSPTCRAGNISACHTVDSQALRDTLRYALQLTCTNTALILIPTSGPIATTTTAGSNKLHGGAHRTRWWRARCTPIAEFTGTTLLLQSLGLVDNLTPLQTSPYLILPML